MTKALLSGNEAIARGAWEAGATVGAGYPGTPSTEILESLVTYPEVNTEWSINEKVALEVGLGACWAGARTLVTMKHVGVNVAADPLFSAAYIGVKGGCVIVTADEPGMHSSQNEQDNRHYARAAKIPMFEPSDSQETKDYTKLAFEYSEKYDTPVFLRITTRLAHSMAIVDLNEREEHEATGFEPDSAKYVMIPAFARKRHPIVEERLTKLAKDAETISVNTIEKNSNKIGIITSGIPYTYVKEALPDASILKLGLVFPLPEKMIREFSESVDELYVVEELDPFIEDQLKAWGIKCTGKEILTNIGEYSPELLRQAIGNEAPAKNSATELQIPARPPQLCAGCPHGPIFKVLKDMKLKVTGDIGCYALGALPPYSSMDTCVDMGASFPLAQGMEMAMGPEYSKQVVAVLGDSTFAHSGITGLLNAVWNKRHGVYIVLDNATTAMTGMQPNPTTGENIYREETPALDYRKLGEGCGIHPDNIKIVDVYKPAKVKAAIEELQASGKVSLLVAQGLCIIERRKLQKLEKLKSKQEIRAARLDQ